MAYLRVENLSLALEKSGNEDDGARFLRRISLDVEKNEIVGLLGPSGAGKSLLLRVILGLTKPDEGAIFVEGQNISERPPSERRMAYLSQRLVLYPHLTSEENAGFFYWIRGLFRSSQKIRFHPVVKEILEAFCLTDEDLLKRLPKSIAGGEKQRIALARALASEADILLLDEPLANIEDHFRDILRRFLRRWIQARGQTALIVSHNQEEMSILCDRLLLLDQGQIIQQGTYENLCSSPISRITALFIGLSQKNDLSSEDIKRLWGIDFPYDVVIPPEKCRWEQSDSMDLEVLGPVIMIENFFTKRSQLLCIEYQEKMLFLEVPESYPVSRGEKIRFYIPLREGWVFEREYPYRRIYQGVWE